MGHKWTVGNSDILESARLYHISSFQECYMKKEKASPLSQNQTYNFTSNEFKNMTQSPRTGDVQKPKEKHLLLQGKVCPSAGR